ncbi:HAD family hydrolase [Nocardia jiangxiensis]|uniref:HAD family hydrolase n=1 Tax=Nocardia jiangxiensis TaxID=282685 RepID=UPI0002D3A5F7|nr:HAD family hydrolase [Nocardia jiangxiensis]
MCAPTPPQAVLFDLDGTLVQTREASWRVFEKISARHGLGVTEPAQYFDLLTDNLFVAIGRLCRDAEHAAQVEREFMDGLIADYDPMMIPGMADVVKALVPHATLAVLSSNSTTVIRRILQANKLEYCFGHVFGGDVEPDKAKGIERFLADAAQGTGRLCLANFDESGNPRVVDPASTVIVTDTVGDVEAAVRAGIRAVGVAWGMHTTEQLTAAGAEFVAIWPQEILAHLFTGVPHAPAACGCTVAGAVAGPVTETAPIPRVLRRISGAHQLMAAGSGGEISPVSAPPAAPSRAGVAPVQAPVPSATTPGTAPVAARRSGTDPELLAAMRLVLS